MVRPMPPMLSRAGLRTPEVHGRAFFAALAAADVTAQLVEIPPPPVEAFGARAVQLPPVLRRKRGR